MWILLGLVAFLASLVLSLHLRRQSRWAGVAGRLGDLGYEEVLQPPAKKRSGTAWKVGISALDRAEFRLKVQSRWDSLYSRLGVSNEVQTGDREFDQRIYVVADHAAVRQALSADAQLRRLLLVLFEMFRGHGLQHVSLSGGRLWLQLHSASELHVDQRHRAIQLLGEIRGRLPQVSKGAGIDPFFWRAALVLSVSTALAVGGFLLLLGAGTGRYPKLLETGGLWGASLILAPLLLAAFLLLSLIWLKRSARSHLILFELLTVGAFGIWAWTFCGLRELNFRLDDRPAQVRELALLERTHTTSTSRSKRGRRRTSHHYHLYFEPLQNHQDRLRFKVSSDEYSRAKVGERWAFTLREGRLGWAWLERGELSKPVQ